MSIVSRDGRIYYWRSDHSLILDERNVHGRKEVRGGARWRTALHIIIRMLSQRISAKLLQVHAAQFFFPSGIRL